MPRQPLVEVFGFPISDQSEEAKRHRHHRLCPFNNRVPSCTKDKIDDPLGVCSIYEGEVPTIVCPVRFREAWHIASDAAEIFFPGGCSLDLPLPKCDSRTSMGSPPGTSTSCARRL